MTVSGDMMEAGMAAARAAASDFSDSADLAGAALDRLARDGADGDGSGRERVAAVLVRRATLEAALVAVILELEGAGERLFPAFERLKVGESGRAMPAFLLRRKDVAAGPDPARILALAGEVEAWLYRADAVLILLSELRDGLKRRHADAEATLGGVVERRGAALAGLAAARKAVEEMHPPLTGIRLQIAGAADDAARTPLEAERARLEADLAAAKAQASAALSACRALDELIALFDAHMNALNTQIAAQNAMIGKVSADIERGVLLHGAVASFAAAAGAQGDAAAALAANADGSLAALLARARKGFLNHAETMRRKALCDEAFALRFNPETGPDKREGSRA